MSNPRIQKWKERPMSWSQISTFQYSKDDWLNKYILDLPQPSSPELEFGKAFADSCEARTPLAPVTLLDIVEHPFEASLGDVKLVGYADSISSDLRHTLEYKTGVKQWDAKRVQNHLQIDMYALMNFLTNGIKPEDCRFALEWIPTRRITRSNADFSGYDYRIVFATDPPEVRHFETKRTMGDILAFGALIRATRKEMEAYAQLALANIPTQ